MLAECQQKVAQEWGATARVPFIAEVGVTVSDTKTVISVQPDGAKGLSGTVMTVSEFVLRSRIGVLVRLECVQETQD